MAFQLEDGLGSGRLAKVDGNNHLHTLSTSRTIAEDAAVINGDAYNINTGLITLTDATKSAVLYVKNNETEKSLIITTMIFMIGNSTGPAAGDTLIEVLRNPTAGTIVSTALACDIPGINRHFGSSRTFNGDMFKGAQGNTFTDGTLITKTLQNAVPIRVVVPAGELTLPPGTSIGIDYTPGTGNTSMDVQFALGTYLTVPE